MTRLKMAETDVQVQLLTRAVAVACVALASSLDALPPDTVAREMRARWARQLRQAVRAMELVGERLDIGRDAERTAFRTAETRFQAGTEFCGAIDLMGLRRDEKESQ